MAIGASVPWPPVRVEQQATTYRLVPATREEAYRLYPMHATLPKESRS